MPDQKDQDLNSAPPTPTQPITTARSNEGEPYVVPEPSQVVKDNEVAEVASETPHPEIPDSKVIAGVRHQGPSAPVATEPTGQVQVPGLDMSVSEVLQNAKGNVSDSKTWKAKLAEMVLNRLKILGLKGANT